MKMAVLFLIGLYQRYISPYKGYSCAYRKVTGRRSCSEYARYAIRRRGLLVAFQLQRRQFIRCAEAAAKVGSRRRHPGKRPKWFDWCECGSCLPWDIGCG